jgi:hypothetical protein
MKFLVVYGNPVDGCSYCGPFEHRGDAFAWADDNVTTQYDYWITVLEEPKENEHENP